jgi:hypothetical protein
MTASFSGPGKQALQPVLGTRAQIGLKMQLRNPPQGQTPGQLMAQVVLRVLKGGEGCSLDLFIAPNSNDYMGMTSIRGDVDEVHFDRQQARVGHLEADKLDQFLSHRFRYSPGPPFVHRKTNKLKHVPLLRDPFNHRAYQLGPQQLGRFLLDRLQHQLAVGVIGGHRHGGDQSPLPKILVVYLGYRYVELVPEPVFQALHHVPLVFQRVGIFHSNFHGQYANRSHLGIDTGQPPR